MNVGSYVELELVRIANVLGIMRWSKYFIKARGHAIKKNVLYDDTKFTILLAKNGCMSTGKANKHIQNQYFRITDKIALDKLTVKHRGMELMWVDGNMKPIKGNKFQLFRSALLGIPLKYDYNIDLRNIHSLFLTKAEAK